jgi:hypothetical protein
VQLGAREDQSRGRGGPGAGLAVGGRRRRHLVRGLLLAGAAAAILSLWSVDDGRTAALMEQMYQHLGEGCTVPQALRLAMLRLSRCPAIDQPVSEKGVADGLQEAWKRPMHWAGFLVMGASTRLPRGDAKVGNAEVRTIDDWLRSIALQDYAAAIKEYGYDALQALDAASEEQITEMTHDPDVAMKKRLSVLARVKEAGSSCRQLSSAS